MLDAIDSRANAVGRRSLPSSACDQRAATQRADLGDRRSRQDRERHHRAAGQQAGDRGTVHRQQERHHVGLPVAVNDPRRLRADHRLGECERARHHPGAPVGARHVVDEPDEAQPGHRQPEACGRGGEVERERTRRRQCAPVHAFRV